MSSKVVSLEWGEVVIFQQDFDVFQQPSVSRTIEFLTERDATVLANESAVEARSPETTWLDERKRFGREICTPVGQRFFQFAAFLNGAPVGIIIGVYVLG
jgi:hypothetical protein